MRHTSLAQNSVVRFKYLRQFKIWYLASNKYFQNDTKSQQIGVQNNHSQKMFKLALATI